ncbi:glycosyltransferase family 4 protein [Patescibacteria group bacterium]|nr:glycosyltransferase family 4 protein [Patescibacteria group bacterium]MBU0964269.1 glycosyltransferase family 4 protein [Patescibacteria group bacterium]
MKIGIDCRTILNPKLGEGAGVGHYTYYLVKNLIKIDKKNQYILFFDWRFRDMKEFESKNVKVKNFPFSQYNKFLPFAYSHMLISAYLIKENLDIFHSPVSSLPLTYPKKSLVTVHDLAIYKNPAWFPSQIFSTKLLVPQSLRKADKIIAVSQSTRKDLKDIFNVPAKKMKVIYEGTVVKKVPVKSRHLDGHKKFKIWPNYIFFVGTLEPRKNVQNIIRAYKKLIDGKQGFQKYQLVLAGSKGYKNEQVFNEIKTLKLAKQVKYIGYITHNQKMDLLRKATCFIFPSSYEGFGLPVVEAMALGTPVITSNVSSLPEVASQAALLVDPEKELDIAKALKRLLSNKALQESLKKKGLQRAKEFTWEKCAKETIKVYESMKK